MIRKIILENYMSHAKTVIEPAEGLTVLIGPNNCGKSAVVSALDTLCNNPSGDYMLRHGEKKVQVTVETDDDHIITWRRKGGTVSYIIDGREIYHLRGRLPEELHKFLRLGKVDPGDEHSPFNVHFGQQKMPVFLLDEPESRAAVFFASSSDAALLIEMQRLHAENCRNYKRDKRRLIGEVKKLRSEIKALQPIEDCRLKVNKTQFEYDMVIEQIKWLKNLSEIILNLSDQTRKFKWLGNKGKLLANLATPPALHNFMPLQGLIGQMIITIKNEKKESERHQIILKLKALPVLADTGKIKVLIKGISDLQLKSKKDGDIGETLISMRHPPEPEDEERLWQTIISLKKAKKHLMRCQSIHQEISKLKSLPDIQDEKSLEVICEDLSKAQAQSGMQHRYMQTLQELTSMPDLKDIAPLKAMIGQWEEMTKLLEKSQKEYKQSNDKMNKLKDEIQAWIKVNPACPTCGAQMELERFMEAGHSHGHR